MTEDPEEADMSTSGTLNEEFSAILEKSPNEGGWTYVVWPESAAFSGRAVWSR